MLRPIAVNTGCQAFDAVDVEIQVNKASCCEIGEQRLFCAGEDNRKLWKGDGLIPTCKVKSGAPRANDVAEAAACGDTRWQANCVASGCFRLAKGGVGRFPAEPRSNVDSFNQRIRYLLFGQPIGRPPNKILSTGSFILRGMDGP